MKVRFSNPRRGRLETDVFASIELFRILLFMTEFLFLVLPIVTIRFLKAVFCSILLR
jgi:hypothetical protein